MVENNDFIEAALRSISRLVFLFFENLLDSAPLRHLRLQRCYIYCSIHPLEGDLFFNNIVDRILFHASLHDACQLRLQAALCTLRVFFIPIGAVLHGTRQTVDCL